MRFERITVEPDKMGGVPCIRGLRIPVATVVGMLAEGMTDEEILADYPDLEAGDIRAALEYAAEAVRERELPVVVRDVGLMSAPDPVVLAAALEESRVLVTLGTDFGALLALSARGSRASCCSEAR
jgi:uncharacterized protein (DUF433 family)